MGKNTLLKQKDTEKMHFSGKNTLLKQKDTRKCRKNTLINKKIRLNKQKYTKTQKKSALKRIFGKKCIFVSEVLLSEISLHIRFFDILIFHSSFFFLKD